MMVDGKGQRINRIPVRFVNEDEAVEKREDDSQSVDSDREKGPGGLTADEIGEASSYEGETEIKRRIDRGDETDTGAGRERADQDDAAGRPGVSEMPEQREDLDRHAKGAKGVRNGARPPGPEHAPSDNTSSQQAAGPMVAELVATRAELKRVEAERADLLEKLARRQADFENYRKRVERERGESYNRLVADVVTKLLPVLDNLQRALDAENSVENSESEEFRHFLHGVELIAKQLGTALADLGLEPVNAVGKTFDPHVHEAVAIEQTQEYAPDTVMQEIVRGYQLGGKLLRPSMVKVATR